MRFTLLSSIYRYIKLNLTVFRNLDNNLEIQLEILVNQQLGECGKHWPEGDVVDIRTDRGVDLM